MEIVVPLAEAMSRATDEENYFWAWDNRNVDTLADITSISIIDDKIIITGEYDENNSRGVGFSIVPTDYDEGDSDNYDYFCDRADYLGPEFEYEGVEYGIVVQSD